MSAKNDEKPSMSSAAITSDLTKKAALTLVKRAEYRTGSRMLAYADVARAVGAKASWIRWFVNCPEANEPNWTVGWNLIDQFNRLCDRGMEADRHELQTLQGKINAATSPAVRMVEAATRTEESATNMEVHEP